MVPLDGHSPASVIVRLPIVVASGVRHETKPPGSTKREAQLLLKASDSLLTMPLKVRSTKTPRIVKESADGSRVRRVSRIGSSKEAPATISRGLAKIFRC